jgi:hypothetical protein
MIRNEERLLDDLPEERGTMTAREALAFAFSAANIRDSWSTSAEMADEVITELARLGYQVLPSIPSPR